MKLLIFFIIVEGNKTWQNNPKKFRFNIEKFSKFKSKIIYIKVEDLPDGETIRTREKIIKEIVFQEA